MKDVWEIRAAPSPQEIEGVTGRHLSGDFSIIFWYRCDRLVFKAAPVDIEVLKFVGGRRKLRIVAVEEGFFAKFDGDTRRTIVELCPRLLTSEWCHVAIIFRHSICSFEVCVNGENVLDADLCSIEFPDVPLITDIGLVSTPDKTRRNKTFAQLADLQIFSAALSKEDRYELMFGDPTLLPGRVELFYKKPLQLDKTLSDCFRNSSLCDQLFGYNVKLRADVLCWLLEPLFLDIQSSYSVTHRIAESLTQVKVDSRIYLCLYSLLWKVPDPQQWFEKLIMNFWIWSRCDQYSLHQILLHITNEVVADCQDLLLKQSFFCEFLVVLDLYFPFSATGDSIHRQLLITLLTRLALTNLTPADADSLFIFCVSAKDVDGAIGYLQILQACSAKVDDSVSTARFADFFRLLLRMSNPQLAQCIIHSAFQFPSFDPMILALLLPMCHEPIAIFNRLLQDVVLRPEFIEVVAIMARFLSASIGLSLQTLMSGPKSYACDWRRPTWFVWPVILAFQGKVGDSAIIVKLLAAFSCNSPQNVSRIGYFMTYLEHKFKTRERKSVLYLYLHETSTRTLNSDVLSVLITLALANFMFHDPAVLERPSRALLDIFMTSPFLDQIVSVKSPARSPSMIQTLNDLKLFFAQIPELDLSYGIRFGPNVSFIDSRFLQLAQALSNQIGGSRWTPLINRFVHQMPLLDFQSQIEEFSDHFYVAAGEIMAVAQRDIFHRIEATSVLFREIARSVNVSKAEKDAVLLAERKRTDINVRVIRFEIRRSAHLCCGCPVRQRQRLWREPQHCQFETNSVVTIFDRQIEAHSSITSSSVIIRFDHKTVNMPIALVVTRIVNSYEVFTTTNRSYLMQFKGQKKFADKSPSKYNWTTNFEFLLLLNRMSGRSFHDSNCYPCFPNLLCDYCHYTSSGSLKNFLRIESWVEPRPISKVEDAATEFATATFIAPEFYCFPELICGGLPNWAKDTFEFVYGLRKILESDRISMLLSAWIWKVWGPVALKGISHKWLFPNAFPEKPMVSRKNSKRFAFQLDHQYLKLVWFNHGIIGCLANSGTVRTYLLEELSVKNSDEQCSEHVDEFEWYSVGGQLYCYDRCDQVLTNFFDKEKFEKFEVEPNLFWEFGSEMLYCRSLCELYIGERLVCKSDNRIVTVAGSATFQVVVFATSDRNVHFHTARKGNEIAKLSLNGLVELILITETWGFVLLHSTGNLYVYNVNGTKIKEMEWEENILKWTTFASPYGFDYVACLQRSGDVIMFEAFYPEKTVVLLEQCWGMLGMTFDAASERIVMVTDTARIDAIPVVFEVPEGPANA
jgi:hypothetical protein